MIYLIFCILVLLRIKGWNSITKLLFVLFTLTSASSYLVGRQPDLYSIDSFWCSIYTLIVLSILFFSFYRYSEIKGIDDKNISTIRLHKIERILIFIGVIAFLIDFYILYKIFPLLVSEQINVQEYKNEGGAYDVIDQFIPHIFVTFSNLVSAVGYFFLSMHFYYLCKRQTRKSILFLLLSLIIIISRMIALSRSSSIEYLAAYGIMFAFISPVLGKKILRRVSIAISFFILVIFIALFTISDSRFSSYYTKTSKQEAILDEKESPLLFSTIDYFTQWEECGEYVLLRFQPSYIAYGTYGFGGIYGLIEQKIVGVEVKKEREKKMELVRGDVARGFPGLVADLVIDFGFIGTVIFSLFLYRLVQVIGPRNRFLPFGTLLFLPFFLIVLGLFWAGNLFSNFFIETGVLYNFFIYKYIHLKNVH